MRINLVSLLLSAIHIQCIWSLNTYDFGSKYIEIDNLDSITRDNHHDIFRPLLESIDDKANHNIHVKDIFGKFMKLKYEAIHPENTKIFKLDAIKNDITSLICDEEENNKIEIEFIEYKTTESYYTEINSYINEQHGIYYIAGSYRWKCKDKNTNKYSPLIRRINSIKLDASSQSLVVTTEYASYTDIFESLDLEFITNAKMFHSPSTATDRKTVSKRRRLSWWSDVWDDITSGVKNVVNHIKSWVDDIGTAVTDLWDGVEDIVDILEGKTVTRNLTDNYFWSYNYDSSSDAAIKEFYLDKDDNVNCINCYVWFDLMYTFKIKIQDRSMKYLYIVGQGDAKMFAEIELKAKLDLEFNVDTPKVPIPYLSIDVFGIEFGFVVYGGVGFGVEIEIDYIWFQYTAYGTIKRGIEYDADSNTQNYIGEHSFNYDKQGPQLEFNSINITFYLKPTIYLALNYIGDVYFGVQPEIEFTFTKDVDYYDTGDSSACAIDYVPTAKLLVFIGAELKPLDLITIWSKEPSLEVAHAVLTSLEGCITQSEITSLETYLGASSSRRRRLESDEYNDEHKNCYIDYTNTSIKTKDRFYKWGSRNSQWWANMTTLTNVCANSEQLTDGNNIWPVNRPKTGNLLIKVKDNKGGKTLIGIYKTYIALYKKDGWGITTNVTCLSRSLFSRTNIYADFNGIDNYNVELLEYYCDVNMSIIGIDTGSDLESLWIDMISLPSTMNAIILDSSFGNIMLFDDDWCHVFMLAKQRKYDIESKQIMSISWKDIKYQYPSQQWFGSYHCIDDNVMSVSLYFQSIDWENGTLTAWLIEAESKQYLHGMINYTDFSMDLWNLDKSLKFIGIISLLQDGTLLYSGTVDIDNCTGFVFQGYVNTEPLNNLDNEDVVVNTNGSKNYCPSSTKKQTNALIIGIFIGIGICALIFIVGFIIKRCYNLNKKQPDFKAYNLINDQL